MISKPTPEQAATIRKFASAIRAMMDEAKVDPQMQSGICVATSLRIISDGQGISREAALEYLIESLMTAHLKLIIDKAEKEDPARN